jgi:hypothetical protein
MGKQMDHAETAVVAECTPSRQVLGSTAGDPWSQDLYTQATAEAFASSKQALQAFVRMAARSPRSSPMQRMSLGQEAPDATSACRSSGQCCQSSQQQPAGGPAAPQISRCQDSQGCSSSDSSEPSQQYRPLFFGGAGHSPTCPQEAAAVFSQLERMAFSQQELGAGCSGSSSAQHQASPFSGAQPPMQLGFAAAPARLPQHAASSSSQAEPQHSAPASSPQQLSQPSRPPRSEAGTQASPFAERFTPRRVPQNDAGPNAFAAAAQSPFGRAITSPFDGREATQGAASAPLSGPAGAGRGNCRSAFDSTPAEERCCQPSSLLVDGVDLRKELHIGACLPPN